MKPAAMKNGKLYSQQPHSGAGDFNFSRADGVQTRINKHGLIETVANNEPRLSYDIVDGKVSDCPHLLLEPSRSNYLQRAEEFSNSYWTKYNSSISPDETVAPDGAVTADKLVENTVNTQHEMGRAFGFTSGVTYTVSVFAKSSERNLQIRGGNTNTFPANSNFDLSNGTIQSTSLGTAYIEDYGNGWYRCVVKATAAASSTTNVNFRLVEGSSSTYTGDGSSGVFLWGAQSEIGLYPTSYIPTSGSTEARQADACNGSGNSETFNDSEGVFFVEIQALEEGSSASRRITLSDESTNNRLLIETDESTGAFKFFIAGSGTVRTIATSTGNTQTDINKLAIGYDGVNAKAYINGTQVGSITNATTRTGIDTIDIADWNGTSQVYYGKIKELTVINEALTDEQLQLLTTP